MKPHLFLLVVDQESHVYKEESHKTGKGMASLLLEQ